MSNEFLPLSKETVLPPPSPPRSLQSRLMPFALWLTWVTLSCLYGGMLLTAEDARHLHDDVRYGALGLIRSPERWSDPNTVSYRSWEADSVIVAVAPESTVLNRPAVGTRCYVHGATVVQVRSRDQTDALLMINGHADHRDGSDLNTEDSGGFIVDESKEGSVREVGDCPDGTMFIASLEEAHRMIQNEHTRETRWESDTGLLQGYARDAAHFYSSY